jgi:hypothetical protein
VDAPSVAWPEPSASRPLDQAHLQFQFLAQPSLFDGHLSIIPLMVKPCQMENAVEHENLHLVG